MFGIITALSADSITIKPEVPEFIKQRVQAFMEQHGKGQGKGPQAGPGGRELPESITVALSADTHFVVAQERQETNPFKVGDKVAIRPAGAPGEFVARAVSDYATAEARMNKLGERMQQGRERRQERREKRQAGQE